MTTMTENEWRYNQLIKLFPSAPEPAFETAAEQRAVWGREWGCRNDTGRLRSVLVHRPGNELAVVDTARRLEIGAFGDVEAGWYWRGNTGPDLAAMQAQHDALVAALMGEGVEVICIDRPAEGRMKTVYTRDVAIAVDGGVIVTRMGPRIRRGEELPATRTLAAAGCPILRTLTGTAIAEGGSFAWIDDRTAVIGMSSRVNEEGARQIEEVLRTQGVSLLRVELTGYRLHIDGTFLMVAPDLALLNPAIVPFWFLEELKARGIHAIEVHHSDNPWIINSLAVAPGRLIMAEGASDHTMEALHRHGVSVITVPYDQVCSGGGGIHCSTAPLIRDAA
ncbi:dimethylarginine dimethylaminohydrolase family protein [Paralimibaculum aggregatum]|uniref:arginine deiminase n=1 Tax=Paralimibaculum aggregatum TaxID=3036245 RepID=A0ABQ6LL89_9RHOB|nr:arginine deiminase family protein [Limibaculum sp. NKW23]GMG81578.1 dimethylarginine dimethylaminohydrolase family protein [Limibaculum sp. NKW23]